MTEKIKPEKETKTVGDFEVREPKIIKPVDLPLVVSPKGGKWANEAQAKYSKTLNAYAYRNPVKWDIKKDALLENLKKVGKNAFALDALIGKKLVGKGTINVSPKEPPK